MNNTNGMFIASALLYSLPALIGAVRYVWETTNEKASSALAVALVSFVSATAWWLDVIADAQQNEWMVGCLLLLPLMMMVVYQRGGELLKLRSDLDPKKAMSLAFRSWCITIFFLGSMLVAMGIILNRLA